VQPNRRQPSPQGDSVAQKLAPRIETEVTRVMQSSIAPMLECLARTMTRVTSVSMRGASFCATESETAFTTGGCCIALMKKVESDMERHFKAQINHYETQRQSDTAKIEEMSAVVALVRGQQRNGFGQATQGGRHLLDLCGITLALGGPDQPLRNPAPE
jgi:hypothetical protein